MGLTSRWGAAGGAQVEGVGFRERAAEETPRAGAQQEELRADKP